MINSWFVYVGVAGSLIVFAQFWRRVVIPLARFVQATVHFAEQLPVLTEIAKEFKPNDGDSLVDRMSALEQQSRDGRKAQEQIFIQNGMILHALNVTPANDTVGTTD